MHISKVLSVQLDDWTEDRVEFMAGVGNQFANSFLEYHVPGDWLKPSHLEPRKYRESYIKVSRIKYVRLDRTSCIFIDIHYLAKAVAF